MQDSSLTDLSSRFLCILKSIYCDREYQKCALVCTHLQVSSNFVATRRALLNPHPRFLHAAEFLLSKPLQVEFQLLQDAFSNRTLYNSNLIAIARYDLVEIKYFLHYLNAKLIQLCLSVWVCVDWLVAQYPPSVAVDTLWAVQQRAGVRISGHVRAVLENRGKKNSNQRKKAFRMFNQFKVKIAIHSHT